ncbi:hypothetical protein PHYBOEH_005585 [Phytophthora boehmeriae]|uniref:DUF1736 domain-containing protein n=1 Tax=Phytophthora boehmeriae TaxID=109152 RepID=A0A8T1WJB3_9STRA|nr:hypothetical protein PHYBOEH_005585 [Phytophthora boehmeriae]
MLIGRNSAGLRLVTTIEDLAAMLVDLTPAEASVLAPLCVFLAALLTAWNANLNGFVWDDRSAVLSNLDTQSSSLYEIFTHDFWGMDIRSVHSHKSYRPLTILSFRLNFMMAGGHSAWLYHVTNAAVHAGCALLCYCVACVLFRQHHDRERGRSSGPTANDTENPQDDSLKNPALDDAERSEKGVSIGALSAGLLFAVHPIHCDAVASIVGRADLLCTCLSLMAFLAYVRGAATTGYGVTSWSCVALALTLTIASGLCKELGFTTFALLVVYDVLGFCSEKHEGSKLRAMKFRLMVTAIVGIVAAATRVWINGEHRQMEWNILANNIVVQESRLTRILSYAHVHAWYLWKLVWPRWFCFDYGYNTVPVIETITDFRNLYTLLAYIVVWKDEDKISLEEFLASDTIASATRFLDHALRQNSVFPTHFYHRAIIAYESGDYDEAIKFFRMTELANAVIRDRQVDPELLIEPAVIYNMLGACYSKKKQLNEALEILRTGISKHPEETDLHVNTALILLELDNPQEAEAQLKAGLIASKERYHIPKLRHVAKVLESHGLLNAVDLFLDHAARLEREYSG